MRSIYLLGASVGASSTSHPTAFDDPSMSSSGTCLPTKSAEDTTERVLIILSLQSALSAVSDVIISRLDLERE